MPDNSGTAGEATGPLTQEAAATVFEGLLGDQFDEPAEEVAEEEAEESAEEETDEGQEEAEESADEDEDSDEDAAEGDDDALIPVKVDGKIEKVTLDELKKGYSRTKDYTQKTMDLAEKRKGAEAAEAAVVTERAKLAEIAKTLTERLTANGDPEPDWDALRRDDPVEWAIQRQVWAEKREEAQRLTGLQQALAAQNAEAAQKTLAAQLEAEQGKLLEKMPAWKKDAARMQKDMTAIQEFAATELGFTPDELANIYDHRAVLALHDAMRFRQMVKKQAELETSGKVKTVAKSPKPLVPSGAGNRPSKTAARRNAIERVSKTGRVDDAANAFASLGLFG